MLFTSVTYLVFLSVVVPLVRLAKGVWRERVLLGASFVFYAAWDVRFLAVLLGIGLFTFWAGGRIAQGKKRFALVAWPIAAILLVLSVFKYTGMLVELVNVVLPAAMRLPIPAIILPLGISFFTFECISYLIDLHQGAKQLLPLRRFLLFPAFWPHMVAGPILRIKEFAPQVEKLRDATAGDVLFGVDRILVGLAKKVLLADSLGAFVEQGFPAGGANSAVDSWALAVAFGLQIYFDFSSYTDIAIGAARMVGIHLPENFNLPYHAASPTDFWNRWHMTLSRWIRDYLFFPLNMKAGRRIWLRYVYLVLAMTLVGLWHGAGLGFILWGTWHGLLMVGHRLLQGPARRLSDRQLVVAGWMGRLVTLALVSAGWVLFRGQTVRQSGAMLWNMFTLKGLRPAYSVNDYLLLVFAVLLYFALSPALQRLTTRDPATDDSRRWTFWLRPFVYAATIALLFMFDRSNVAFIYFQF
jgi:alginate O-acetyltransferase complex protein AlgI